MEARTIKLGEGLLEATFAQLRACGRRKRECVAYWVGPLRDLAVVSRVLHPGHEATASFYEVEQAWLHRTWLELEEAAAEIRVQIHTHGHAAFHSRLDDEYPVAQTAGLLSLVLPDFAQGPIGFDGAYLVELQRDGSWLELDPREVLIDE